MPSPAAQEPFADLEIHVLPRRARPELAEGDGGYPVDLILAGQRRARGHLAGDILPWVSSGVPAADGCRLFEALLADGGLRQAWGRVEERSKRRRIRLHVDVDAAELHALPWESLQEGSVTLSAQAETPFSRYLPVNPRWSGPVVQRPVRLLVAISDPADLETRSPALHQAQRGASDDLAPVDVALERSILEGALAGVEDAELQCDFLEPPVTLERLEAALRDGVDGGTPGYHALHFVGHGAFSPRRGQAALYLQDEDGNAERALDQDLADMLARQEDPPHLVTLSACQSASRSTTDAFAGLGPKLMEAGVPAVVAMQSVVAVVTARQFYAEFYRRLLAHGLVDLAVNEARSTLLTEGRLDAAVPVLFMQLRDGQFLDHTLQRHREALRQQLAADAKRRWGGMAVYIQEEGAALPIQASPYQAGQLGPRQNLLRTLHAAGRLLVLGEPGTGKTVALERLAWELCNGPEPRVPVIVRLFQYAGAPLADWVRACLEETGQLRLDDDDALRAFLKGNHARCFFLFDGLNEVRPPYRDTLVAELIRWMKAHPNHPVILSSRSQDELWRRLRADVDQAVVVQPISDEQAQAYLVDHLGGQGADLYEQLDRRLRELARTPLLLWLIKEGGAAEEAVPASRGELYARFVKRMLKRDTDRRLDAEISSRLKRCALIDLAYHLGQDQRLACGREEAVEVAAQGLDGDLDRAEDVVGACARHGLLAGEDEVWFSPHQTVQEHFAALALRALVDREQGLGRWERLCRVGRRLATRQEEGLAALAQDDWWWETFVQLAGLVDDADWLAREVARVNPWLAWWCVSCGTSGGVQGVRDETRRMVEDRSVGMLESDSARDRRRAVGALARMRSERAGEPLLRAAADPDGEVSGLAVQGLVELGEAGRALVKGTLEGEDRRLWVGSLRYLMVRSDDQLCGKVPVETLEGVLGLPVVWVPPGPFLMGRSDADKQAQDREKPQHQVTLPGYWIGRYPVTNAQFARFIEGGGYRNRSYWTEAGWERRESQGWTQPRYWNDGKYNDPAQPVVSVSWYEAVAYCRWLSERSGLPVALPSEAQWEKAARGTDGCIYPWGDQEPTDKLCNSGQNVGRTTPVGEYSPAGDSPYGCADMAGNVWEWTSSLFNPYPYDPEDGREDPDSTGTRVLRGGAFVDSNVVVRCSARYNYYPYDHYRNYGFRVVVSPISRSRA